MTQGLSALGLLFISVRGSQVPFKGVKLWFKALCEGATLATDS